MGVKKYFQRQFRLQMFKLDCGEPSDFYIGCFQKNHSCVPLLLIRALLFFGSVGIVIASLVIQIQSNVGAYWFIYLTHWGILFIMIACGFGFAVSLAAYFRGPIDGTFGLPWYVKGYWILYNIATPLALFITFFYWVFLYGLINNDEVELDLALDPVLDIFIHAVNSVLMLVLMFTSRHPCNILHFYFVFLQGLLYMFFSIIYYYAGGTDAFGNEFIYPVLDWSQPTLASVTVVLSTIMIILAHWLTSLLMTARDALGRSYRKDKQLDISRGYA